MVALMLWSPVSGRCSHRRSFSLTVPNSRPNVPLDLSILSAPDILVDLIAKTSDVKKAWR